jgi:O-antigen/teichoic acid export membrane protein
MGIEALLLAHILSLIFYLGYVEIKIHALKYLDFRALKRDKFINMMRFSIPLIPNATFWWLTNSVNSVIITAKLGMDVNGIYSVSSKFTAVLSMVVGVLNMSWQDTAIADYGTKGFNKFFTKTFNTFVKLIFSAISVLIPLISILLPYMIDPTYYDAISFTPFLMLASGISSMSGFMAQIFTGKGNTKIVLTTSIFGMIANIAIIVIFVDQIGIWAAVIGSLAADIVIFASRTFIARKEFTKEVNYGSFFVILFMMIVGIICYTNANVWYNAIWFVISSVVALILNRHFVCDLFSVIFGNLLKKDKLRK